MKKLSMDINKVSLNCLENNNTNLNELENEIEFTNNNYETFNNIIEYNCETNYNVDKVK